MLYWNYSRRRLLARTAREFFLSALLAAALFMGVNSVTARSYVEGPSMEPTLYPGQVLLISRLGISGLSRQVFASAHLESPQAISGWLPPRGAIVTVAQPADPGKVLIKRVVGLPGETIAIEEGAVHINGQPLDEPYVVYRDKRSAPPVVVPLDSIYVLGDDRPNSGDSRQFGPVLRSSLLGVAVLRYWPLSQFRLLVGNP